MQLLNEKQALAYLGYSEGSNILAKMRMKTNKGRWEFTPRYIIINGLIRYPKEWLDSDLQEIANSQQNSYENG